MPKPSNADIERYDEIVRKLAPTPGQMARYKALLKKIQDEKRAALSRLTKFRSIVFRIFRPDFDHHRQRGQRRIEHLCGKDRGLTVFKGDHQSIASTV